MIETLKKMLKANEESIRYMEETDTSYSKEYTVLVRQRRVLKSAIRKLERIEKGVA